MKKSIMVFALFVISSTSFADVQDLQIMKTLLKIGAQTEQEMFKTYVSLKSVKCSQSLYDGLSDCSFTDMSANNGMGIETNLIGKKADLIMKVLETMGAPSDDGMGKHFSEAKSIQCIQTDKSVADGDSEAKRTVCSIEF